MNILFYIAVILFAGIIMARVISIIKLPNVTGYLIAGLIIGPSFLNIIPGNIVSKLSIISEAALAFIAYGIGSEFNYNHLLKIGKSVLLITLFESVGAVVVVDFVMIFLFRQPVSFSIMLGAIAAATAPAATIMVVKQYKAKGPVVDTLLPIVALDDAVGIISFGISSAIAKSLVGNQKLSFINAVLNPVKEILLSFIIGIAIGVVLSYISKKARGEAELLSIVIGVLFLSVGLADFLNISSLLTCMMIGATAINIAPNPNRVLSIIDSFTPPVFICFFTIAGVDLDIRILAKVGLIGVGYIIFRLVGKILGSFIGANLAHAPANVRKYLGFALVPQAGVAIGLALLAQQIVPQWGPEIQAITLSATVIYELIGPVMTKMVLLKAREIKTA